MVIEKYEKYIQYALLGAGVLLVLSIYKKGIGGTTRDLTAGIVGGVVDGAVGVIEGAYDGLPNAIKPSSHDNIINQGVNRIGEELTGDPNFTLGGWIYDITH